MQRRTLARLEQCAARHVGATLRARPCLHAAPLPDRALILLLEATRRDILRFAEGADAVLARVYAGRTTPLEFAVLVYTTIEMIRDNAFWARLFNDMLGRRGATRTERAGATMHGLVQAMRILRRIALTPALQYTS